MMPSLPIMSVVALLVVAMFAGTYKIGYDAGRDSQVASQAKAVAVVQQKIDVLATDLNLLDESLLIKQQKDVEIQTVEVIKNVIQYREVIKDRPIIVECINDSGLLNLLNATMPTVTAGT